MTNTITKKEQENIRKIRQFHNVRFCKYMLRHTVLRLIYEHLGIQKRYCIRRIISTFVFGHPFAIRRYDIVTSTVSDQKIRQGIVLIPFKQVILRLLNIFTFIRRISSLQLFVPFNFSSSYTELKLIHLATCSFW